MSGGADDVYQLATDLTRIGARLVPAARKAMLQGGNAVARGWAANARATSGDHGKHYPKSIGADLAFGISSVSVDVGPDESKPQGGMGPGFEFGSVNQPPHLDGQKAMDVVAPQVEALLEAVVAGTFAATQTAPPGLQQYTTRAGVTRLATSAQIANWTRGQP